MNGIDTIIQRLNTDAKAETDALLEKARQEAAAVAARYQAQADKEVADLAARNERLAAEREERLISAAQMEARKTVLAAKQAVMEETYAKALEKLRNLPEARYVEVLTELLLQAAPLMVWEKFSSPPRIGKRLGGPQWTLPTESPAAS
ncbi:MAG: V-type ATP synthase subunit E [Dysosmobacter sp.]